MSAAEEPAAMRFQQEICVVLLDVGPQMGDLLEPAAKAVSAFIQGKVRLAQSLVRKAETRCEASVRA